MTTSAAPVPPPRPGLHGVRGWLAGARSTLADYARRIWAASGEDNVFFLAGGIAFNLLLAAVPFVLLLIAGLTVVLRLTPDASITEVMALIDRFLPPHAETAESPVHRLITDIIQA